MVVDPFLDPEVGGVSHGAEVTRLGIVAYGAEVARHHGLDGKKKHQFAYYLSLRQYVA
jgi:hypothetical protein